MRSSPSNEATEIRQRLKSDFQHYAAKCLQIRTKTGGVAQFALNRAQRFIHERLEQQRIETGCVRAMILKGRQQGCSTYIGGRYYHRVTHSFGVRAFILTHEESATNNLFEMVQRFHEHCPAPVRPQTGYANAKELMFSALDSGYKIGTAGTRGVGRSSTIQFFHGSEVAFWPNADAHVAGIMQAIPDGGGTESILESTANGFGNLFHSMWQAAERGDNDYQAIFVPWFWQDEYRRQPDQGFRLTHEEQEYAGTYGLDEAQVAWRRQKISELKGADAELLFKQEYPATAAEAFQVTGHDSFIPAELILRARKNAVEPSGQLVIGYDPAWVGDDRHSMAWRRGRRVMKVESKQGIDTMQGAGWAKQVIDTEKPARMFIDVGGVGAGIYDRLNEMGYGQVVVPVNFGGSPFEPPPEDHGGPANRRAEMWMKSKQWLEHVAGVQIPDSDTLHADATAPGYGYNSDGELLIEKKEKMRARGVKSPDEWDAVVLTFAEPVHEARSYDKPDNSWVV